MNEKDEIKYNKNCYIQCSCMTEILHLEYEKSHEDWPEELNISFYTYGIRDSYYSWRFKLRHIWRILKYGTPYSDAIVLNEKEIEVLKEFLNGLKDE